MKQKLEQRKKAIETVDNAIIDIRSKLKTETDDLVMYQLESHIRGLEKEVLRLQTEEVY